MYEKFFGLQKAPFSIMPDPNCVYLTGQHEDAISGLVLGIVQRKGYMVLTGEAGLGKTTALGYLAKLLTDENVQSSVIVNPTLTAPEFLEMAMLNFGLEVISSSKAQRLKVFRDFLTRADNEGKTSALIIDEAHKLSADLLEEVRLLGNFDAADHKLLQIVLVGQTELIDRLNLPELWQLKQRIALRMSLRRLEPEALAGYLQFRWTRVGGSEPVPFTDRAIGAIASGSSGIPRVINAICDNALLIAFSHDKRSIDVEEVREACAELDLPKPVSEVPVRARAAALPVREQAFAAAAASGLAAPSPTAAAKTDTWQEPAPAVKPQREVEPNAAITPLPVPSPKSAALPTALVRATAWANAIWSMGNGIAVKRRTVLIGAIVVGIVTLSGLLIREEPTSQGILVTPPTDGQVQELERPTPFNANSHRATQIQQPPPAAIPASETTPNGAEAIKPSEPTGFAGVWTYPINGAFQGAQPEVVEAVVNEEGGHLTGTVFARFKDSPTMRFEFSGDASNADTQTLSLKATDGTKGSLELKRGSTPDQIEMSLKTPIADGTTEGAGLVLVKK